MVTCDNCGTGQECDNWADTIDFMWMEVVKCGGSEMNIRELQSALEYSREQLFQAGKYMGTAKVAEEKRNMPRALVSQ